MHLAQLYSVLFHTVAVLCEQSVMLTMILCNSHFSHFFLLAALLLSVAQSYRELIKTAAELMQQHWRLGAPTVDVTVVFR